MKAGRSLTIKSGEVGKRLRSGGIRTHDPYPPSSVPRGLSNNINEQGAATDCERSPSVALKAGRKPGMVATPSGSSHFSESEGKSRPTGRFLPVEFQEDSAAMSHSKGSLNVE